MSARGQWFNLSTYIEDYGRRRGMNFWNDVHDWLGGYPYESIAPDDAKALMERLGFIEERSFLGSPGRHLGILGSGCDEYSFVGLELINHVLIQVGNRFGC